MFDRFVCVVLFGLCCLFVASCFLLFCGVCAGCGLCRLLVLGLNVSGMFSVRCDCAVYS